MSESVRAHEAHAAEAARRKPIWCAVLTVSDTRQVDDDISGQRIVAYLEQAGHLCVKRSIVRDEPDQINAELRARLADPDIHVILITGGTGIGRRDRTIEIVSRVLTHPLDGFGELFRMLSWEQVGAASMLSRAVGGMVSQAPDEGGDTFIFAMPGSPNAVNIAMQKLIIPQLPHLVWQRGGT
jgi:molybdenum cofactor biosynthesis protein B